MGNLNRRMAQMQDGTHRRRGGALEQEGAPEQGGALEERQTLKEGRAIRERAAYLEGVEQMSRGASERQNLWEGGWHDGRAERDARATRASLQVTAAGAAGGGWPVGVARVRRVCS